MTKFSRTFGLLAGAGVAAIGLTALSGLVSPVASDYLWASSETGDTAISKIPTSLVRVHLTRHDRERLTVMRDGKPTTLVLEFDPDCLPPAGWV